MRRVFFVITIVCLLGGAPPAEAGLGEFFKKLGNSIAPPKNKQAKQRSASKKTTSKRPAGKPDTSASPSPGAGVVTLDNEPLDTPVPLPTPPPVIQPPVRLASSIPAVGGRKRDIPYGIPVPNRPGFVTSPYAPSQGLVDVRSFPSGTEVKDPYSNKVFLTP